MTTRSVEMPNDKPLPSADPLPLPDRPPASAGQAVIDDTATLYSILVPGETESYVRLGTPDGTSERRLPGDGTSSPYDPGILLYTTGTIEQTARRVVTHTTDRLDLRGSDFGMSAANWSTSVAAGFLAQASFQRGDLSTATVGAVQSTVVGSQTAMMLGKSAQLSAGFRLNANYGSAQNLYWGQVINLVPGTAEVRNPGGSYSTDEFRSIAVSGRLRLIADESILPIIALNQMKVANYRRLMAITAGVAALGAALTAALPWTGSDSERRQDTTRDLMTATAALSAGVATALALIQAIGLLLSLRIKRVHGLAWWNHTPRIVMEPGGIMIEYDQTRIIVNPESVQLSSGDESVIHLSSDGMRFRIGESAVVFRPGGIEAQERVRYMTN